MEHRPDCRGYVCSHYPNPDYSVGVCSSRTLQSLAVRRVMYAFARAAVKGNYKLRALTADTEPLSVLQFWEAGRLRSRCL